jgi:hypothetical protein
MSPTQLAVRLAAIHEQVKAAGRAGDLPRMQQLAGQHQRLLESIYGSPLAKPEQAPPRL